MMEDYRYYKERCLKPDMAQKPIYAQMVTARLSLAIVRLISNTGIRPNEVTFFALLIGILSGIFMIAGTPLMYLWAALMLELFYVLDMVDGELARYKKACTLTGAFFDHIAIYLIHPWIFLCLGIGLYRYSQNIMVIIAGAMAGIGILLNYIIAETRSSIIFGYFKLRKDKAVSKRATDEIEDKPSVSAGFMKESFSMIHKWSTYPYIMHIISITAFIIGPILMLKAIADTRAVFVYILHIYAVVLNLKWVLVVSHWVRTERIDEDYNPEQILKIWGER